MARHADWYFDFISPYAYLQFKHLHKLPKDLELSLKPVLFAGLLGHWQHKGPAEIPAWRTASAGTTVTGNGSPSGTAATASAGMHRPRERPFRVRGAPAVTRLRRTVCQSARNVGSPSRPSALWCDATARPS